MACHGCRCRPRPLLQGTLLFVLLLLILWLPLLVFSSGAPTYTTPSLVRCETCCDYR